MVALNVVHLFKNRHFSQKCKLGDLSILNATFRDFPLEENLVVNTKTMGGFYLKTFGLIVFLGNLICFKLSMRSGAHGFSFTHLHIFLIPVPCINVAN